MEKKTIAEKVKRLIWIIFILISFTNFVAYSKSNLLRGLSKWRTKLPKSIIEKNLSKLSYKELRKYLTKNEAIYFLLYKAYREGKINPADIYRLRHIHSKLPYGDKFLLLCLKDEKCNPLKFAKKADTWLYQEIVRKYPNISSKKELERISGNFAERFTIRIFEKSSWKCIKGKYRGEHGFDGLCIKTNIFGKVEDVLILESKADDSILGESQCGKQMSKACIISILENLKNETAKNETWFQKFLGRNKYNEIFHLVENNKYRRRLVRVKKIRKMV